MNDNFSSISLEELEEYKKNLQAVITKLQLESLKAIDRLSSQTRIYLQIEEELKRRNGSS